MSRCLIYRVDRPSPKLVARLGLRHRFDELIECAEKGLLVVAAEDGKQIGLCGILRGRKDSDYHIGSMRIRVDKMHRGKGVGARLLEASMKEFPAFGFARVEATPYLENTTAVRLFCSRGFQREGVRVNGGWDGCRPQDTFLLAWTS